MQTRDLRTASRAVFLATDASVAKDISTKLLWAADTIDALRAQIISRPKSAGGKCKCNSDTVEECIFWNGEGGCDHPPRQ